MYESSLDRLLSVQNPLHPVIPRLCPLQSIKDELARARFPLEETHQSAETLGELCGTPGKMEIQKHLEDLDTALEEIEDGLNERDEELNGALDKAERYDQTMQVGGGWECHGVGGLAVQECSE